MRRRSNPRYPKNVQILVNIGDLERRPPLASKVFRILTSWPFVESETGTILVKIIGRDARVAIEKFISRANAIKYSENLLENAKTRLSAEDFEDLRVIVSMYREAYSRRNNFAHLMGGVDEAIPNAFVFINPHDYWRQAVEIEEYVADARENPFSFLDRPKPWEKTDKILVCEESELDEIINDFGVLTSAFRFLQMMVSAHHTRARTLSRDQLYAIPQFQRAKALLSATAYPKKTRSLSQRFSDLLGGLRREVRKFFRAT